MAGIGAFIRDFVARWLWAVTGSVPGAILAAISLVWPSLINWPFWVWAILIFFPAAFLGSYRVAEDLRNRAKTAENKLEAIGIERPLVFVAPELNFQPGGPTYLNLRRLGIRFENTSDRMLSYSIQQLSYRLVGYQEIDANPGGAVGYIGAKQTQGFAGDLSVPLAFPYSPPPKLRISFTITYDNVPPVRERTTEQTIEYTFSSIDPVKFTNLILSHTET